MELARQVSLYLEILCRIDLPNRITDRYNILLHHQVLHQQGDDDHIHFEYLSCITSRGIPFTLPCLYAL